MIAQTIAILLSLASVEQSSPATGPPIQVSVDRNSYYVDSVWTGSGSGGAATVYYQRNGLHMPTMTWLGSDPDVDVDDYGNYVVVFDAPDPNNFNIESIFITVNGSTPVSVSTGSYPAVTISRSTGAIAVVWASSTSGTPTGISAATYSFNGSTLSRTTAPFTVNYNPQVDMRGSSSYSVPDVSSDVSGNYTVTYVRTSAPTSANDEGVFTARFDANSSTAIFPENRITSVQTLGAFQYTRSRASCWSNGETVVSYNFTSIHNIYAVHINASGTYVNYQKFYFPSLGYAELNPNQANGDYRNNLGIACRRSTPGSYVVTWPANVDYNTGAADGTVSNIVYQKVVSDSLVSSNPTFATFGNSNGTQNGPQNVLPAVALSDAGTFYIVYYSQSNTNASAVLSF